MKKLILCYTLLLLCISIKVFAQPATYGVPFSIGRNNCGNSGGTDSVYFFNYATSLLTNSAAPKGCRPILKPKPFSIFAASVSYNPKDQNLYYVWTDYSIPAPYKSYIWRWNPLTCPTAAGGLDTLMSFNFDIGGITFDPDGFAWQIEFSGTPPYKAFLRQLDFTAGVINGADTLDLTANAAGIGDTLYTVGNGDITMTPSGQMYFVFDNKLYTPDYGSYDNPTHHLKATFIDTIRRPTGATSLVGLAFADGDLIASYSPGCIYRKIDPVTGDTAALTYTYAAAKGVKSNDMSQINSGVGASKRLMSVIATGTANQYNVTYDVHVRNFGNVPVTNVQLTDNLTSINTLANLSNVSIAFVSNPAGLTLNPGYNGSSNINILAAGQTLPNYPTANNNFTVRISCRLSNIQPGIVYNNSAIATANGFNNNPLRDSSTNGSSPDLNQNDKPDDLGEGQPTPFIITLTPTTPPCAFLTQVLYTQNFGAGPGLASIFPAGLSASTQYIGTTVAPLSVRRFTVTNNAQNGDNSNWISLTDHTGGINGRMLLVNADAPAHTIYTDTLPVSCPGQQYTVSIWCAFIGNASYQTVCNGLGGFNYPKLLLRIRDRATGLVITEVTTGDIIPTTWQQVGMKWIMPAGYTNVILEIINAGKGGCGNDIAIDDIQYGMCDPVPTVSVAPGSGCIGSTANFISSVSDAAVIPGAKDYQWQVASAVGGPYTDIALATGSAYTISAIAAADTGKFYRVIVAAQGNMVSATCRYFSAGVKLSGGISSVAATSASRNKNNICPGIPVTLSLTGGSLGANASWKWYSGSCAGTLAGTGTSISVTPTVTTTYYVRAEGDCNITNCQLVTVVIACNIDKDRDGIPDYVESYMPLALQDADSDGISNAFDTDYAGTIDINNDYINDNFHGDGDSDNDGILNYLDPTFPGRVDINADGKDDRFDMDLDGIINMFDLDSDNDGIPDVVEAGGVDANGDGKIDNYTDTDGDGLSQNVDINNTGARISGIGLGIEDLDADGRSNALDLDSDNDGIPDVVEALGTDANNNGIIDGFADANSDGLSDNAINASGLLRTGNDINADGRADSYPNKNFDNDKRANPYDPDSDMDGIVDVIEAGFTDANFDGFIDGPVSADGWNTSLHALGSLNVRNTDTRGQADYLDIDADDDGIPDNVEGMTTAGYTLPSYNDTDNDGLDNSYDNSVSFGGRGVFLSDKDIDGVPDYRDLDTDADGQPDIREGNDFNLNGNGTDDLVTLTFLDTDGDGLDNRFDSLNSVTNIRGTSYNMGNGGSTTGDATPGSRSPVQKRVASQLDRDWRFVGIVLGVQFMKFTGMVHDDNTRLEWDIITPAVIDRFEVERSTDNIFFSKVVTVKQPVTLNELQHLGTTDNIASVNAALIYYRLKLISPDGTVQYSKVITIKHGRVATSIFPNPATDHLSIRTYAAKEAIATIRILDNAGKMIHLFKQKVSKGNNELTLTNLHRFSKGVYNLEINIENVTETHKLILLNK